MNRRILICLALPVLASPLHAADNAASVRILAPMMTQGALTDLGPLLRARAGAPLQIEFMPMTQLVERLGKGEIADVVITSAANAQQLAAKGLVKSQADVVVSVVGIAVADNAPTPAMKTEADLIAFLKATPSIAIYGGGGSGALLLQFAAKHGLADVVKRKATMISEGFTAALVREGKVASAVQQVGELTFAGAKNIVRLPDSVQAPSVNRVLVLNGASRPEVADRIAQLLLSPEAVAAYRRAGLTPVVK